MQPPAEVVDLETLRQRRIDKARREMDDATFETWRRAFMAEWAAFERGETGLIDTRPTD